MAYKLYLNKNIVLFKKKQESRSSNLTVIGPTQSKVTCHEVKISEWYCPEKIKFLDFKLFPGFTLDHVSL